MRNYTSNYINIILILLFIIHHIKSKDEGQKQQYNKKIELIPMLEYAQNDTHVFIHIINKKSLPIENLNISLSSTSLKIYYELSNEKDITKYIFNRTIFLFSLCKNNTLYIKKENELNYVIFFEKTIPTFYWSYLDQEIDNHQNIYVWFDLYDKYEQKSKFNEYKDFVESNRIINEYNSAMKENEENKNNILYSSEKRNNKLKKIKEEYEKYKIDNVNYFKYKSHCNSFPSIKKCYSNKGNNDDIFDFNFWLY